MSPETTREPTRDGRREATDAGFASISRFVSDVIIVLDLELRPLSVTPSVQRMLGYTPEEFRGLPMTDLLAPGSLPVVRDALAEEVRIESTPDADRLRSRTLDVELRRRDGSTLWGEVQASFFRDADDRPAGVIAVIRDITAWRATQEALRRSEERLRQVIDLVPQFVFAKDVGGRFILVNQAVADAYGTTVEQLTGRTDADFARSPEEARHFREDDLEVIESGRPKLIPEESITDAMGRVRILQTVKIPFTTADAGTPAVLGVATDITERKATEAKLKEREDQLQRDQRMRAIGQLAGGVAHDFNNLLTVILGHTERLRDELSGQGASPTTREAVDEIRHAAERATSLTRQLLAFSRRQLVTYEIVDLHEVIRDNQRMIRRLIDERIEIAHRLDAARAEIVADRGQVEQVLINLAVNARDAMPEGGTLTIATELAAPAGEAPAHLRLAVADDGIGMDAETRARAFEPFFTTKAQGTGLGLATVFGIVEQAGGEIAIASEPGRGTRVEIRWPLAGLSRPAERADLAEDPKGGDETILVVEDEEAIRRLVRETLEGLGYRVLEAPNAEAALMLPEVELDRIRLLVTDVVLPGASGAELAERFLAASPRGRALLVSGYPQEILERGSRLGPRLAFLAKPYRPVELARRVRELLNQR